MNSMLERGKATLAICAKTGATTFVVGSAASQNAWDFTMEIICMGFYHGRMKSDPRSCFRAHWHRWLRVYRTSSKRVIAQRKLPMAARAACYSPDGRCVPAARHLTRGSNPRAHSPRAARTADAMRHEEIKAEVRASSGRFAG